MLLWYIDQAGLGHSDQDLLNPAGKTRFEEAGQS